MHKGSQGRALSSHNTLGTGGAITATSQLQLGHPPSTPAPLLALPLPFSAPSSTAELAQPVPCSDPCPAHHFQPSLHTPIPSSWV